MAMEWCKKLAVQLNRCPIAFQGHPSYFKVTWEKQSSILTCTECFRTVTPVWMHWWIWNDAHSLMWYRRGVPLFFVVIHKISRSHVLKNRQFESNLSKITRPVEAIKSLRFALLWFHKWTLCFTSDANIITAVFNVFPHDVVRWHNMQFTLHRCPADEFGRGHRNGERPSVRPCIRASVRPGLPTIIRKSNPSFHFKLDVAICWVSIKNWFTFGQRWPDFGPLLAKNNCKWAKMLAILAKFWLSSYKISENGGFRPLSGKLFTQYNSN